MYRIGMRTIKTAIAVFICLTIGYIRQGAAPFYSTIATILCMQPYVKNSIKTAKNRMDGTLIGAMLGAIMLLVVKKFSLDNYMMIQYFIISICVIILIYVTVLFNKKTASYITCVVFLSIVVSHAQDVNPYLFAFNRVLDTFTGILVSLGVNSFRLPVHKNKNIVICFDLDRIIENRNIKTEKYVYFKINRLINLGAKITATTKNTVSDVYDYIKEINFNLPIVIMNGACIYNIENHTYENCKFIDNTAKDKIFKILKDNNINSFSYTVINDIIHVYYSHLYNEGQKQFYSSKKIDRFKRMICSEFPRKKDVIKILLIDKYEETSKIKDYIENQDFNSNINMSISKYNEKYYKLEIYSVDIDRNKSVEFICKSNNLDKVVSIYDKNISKNNHNQLIKLMYRNFLCKKFNKS